jgi:hypothetical protein
MGSPALGAVGGARMLAGRRRGGTGRRQADVGRRSLAGVPPGTTRGACWRWEAEVGDEVVRGLGGGFPYPVFLVD